MRLQRARSRRKVFSDKPEDFSQDLGWCFVMTFQCLQHLLHLFADEMLNLSPRSDHFSLLFSCCIGFSISLLQLWSFKVLFSMTNWITVQPSYKPDGCLLWTQSDAGSRSTLCCLFTLLVIAICLFLDTFRGCGSVGAETSALVPVQGSSHQQPWQQRLHHTQQALHVQQRWRPHTVFGAGLLLIYLLCVCPDSSVNFETLSWDSEQNWFPHSICVISLDFTPLRGQVRSHPFCLIQEQSYQAVHKTQRIRTRTWAHVDIHSVHIHVRCSFPLGARVKFLEGKRDQDSVLSHTKTLHRRSAP